MQSKIWQISQLGNTIFQTYNTPVITGVLHRWPSHLPGQLWSGFSVVFVCFLFRAVLWHTVQDHEAATRLKLAVCACLLARHPAQPSVCADPIGAVANHYQPKPNIKYGNFLNKYFYFCRLLNFLKLVQFFTFRSQLYFLVQVYSVLQTSARI